jgi:predicted MPP superfamily phosphohydrolase
MNSSNITRRRFLRGAGAVTAVSILAIGADATLLGAHHLKVTQLEILIEKLSAQMNGFTIAQIGDFHYDAHLTASVIKAAVNSVNALRPDLVVLMGDYVTLPRLGWDHASHRARARAEAIPCALLLQKLRPKIQTVGVLGNHDRIAGAEDIARTLKSSGIQTLRNESIPIEHDGARIWLAGVDDVLEGTPDLGRALRGIPHGEIVVLLAHEPDYADEVSHYPVDLQLSGHSHGGQIRFPLVGALHLPDLAQKYPWGLYLKGRLTLYTNCGLGTIRVPARLNCPPEITLLTLRSAQG